jgi:hypothetical protein
LSKPEGSDEGLKFLRKRKDPKASRRGRDTRHTGPEPITDPALAREVDRKMRQAREDREAGHATSGSR